MMDIIYIWWNMFIGNNVYLLFLCILLNNSKTCLDIHQKYISQKQHYVK